MVGLGAEVQRRCGEVQSAPKVKMSDGHSGGAVRCKVHRGATQMKCGAECTGNLGCAEIHQWDAKHKIYHKTCIQR